MDVFIYPGAESYLKSVLVCNGADSCRELKSGRGRSGNTRCILALNGRPPGVLSCSEAARSPSPFPIQMDGSISERRPGGVPGCCALGFHVLIAFGLLALRNWRAVLAVLKT